MTYLTSKHNMNVISKINDVIASVVNQRIQFINNYVGTKLTDEGMYRIKNEFDEREMKIINCGGRSTRNEIAFRLGCTYHDRSINVFIIEPRGNYGQ